MTSIQQSPGSAQQGHPSGWKHPSTTEPHIGFLYSSWLSTKRASAGWVILCQRTADTILQQVVGDWVMAHMMDTVAGHNNTQDRRPPAAHNYN